MAEGSLLPREKTREPAGPGSAPPGYLWASLPLLPSASRTACVMRICAEDIDYLRTMNRPKGQPIVIAIMGGVAGYVLCGEALRRVDPSMDSSVIRFFSALAGIVLAGIAWKMG